MTLHVWRVPATRVPSALWRLAHDRRQLRRQPGARFAKLLGTGRGRAFGPGRADLTRWAALVAWDDPDSASAFESSTVARSWRALATAHCRLDLRPLRARGRWAGQLPFQVDQRDHDGIVLALTRARLRPTRAVSFWRAVPPVAVAAGQATGLLAAFGIGEAPVGWQGTVSVWCRVSDLVEFAYRHPAHQEVLAATPDRRWYAEDLFARFAVVGLSGDRDVLGWTSRNHGEEEDGSMRP